MPDRRVAPAYDTVAETYEERFVDELDKKPRDRQLLDDLAARTRGLVLDVGCGPGQIGKHVHDLGRLVIGVDLSREMAGRAAGRLTAAVVADMRALPFPDGAAGAVVAFYSVIHLPRGDLTRALGELMRVLEAGGRVLVSAHEGDGDVEVDDFLGHTVTLGASFFSEDELERAATAAGLEGLTVERRPPYENEGTTIRLYLQGRRPDA